MTVRDVHVTASLRGVTTVTFGGGSGSYGKVARKAGRQLREYLAGKRTQFTLPLDLRGTPFQQSVWKALRIVPFGTTVTYGELAKKIGKPRAVRAVASAVARNPVGIVIPCHRIVPASGPQPGKYAWGEDKKRWLLEHEIREKR